VASYGGFFSEFRLDEPFDQVGHWWLPQQPHVKVNGRVRYSPDSGVTLECGGTLVYLGYGQQPQPCTIHGELNGDIGTTIFHAAGSSNFLQRHANQTFSAGGLLVGTHADSLEQPVSGIELRLSQLNDWFAFGPFHQLCEQHEDSTHLVQYHFEYDPTPTPAYDVPEIKCQVTIGSESKRIGCGHEVKLVHEASIRVHGAEVKPLGEFLRIAHDLELLITLMAGFSSPIQRIDVIPVSSYMQPIEQRQHYLYGRTLKQFGKRFFNRLDMPANFEFVEPNFSDVLNRWFVAARNFDSVIRLLRAALFLPSPHYIENRFLGVAQAVEGFCRIESNENHLPPSEFAVVSEAMRNCIPTDATDEFRELLMSRIGWMNDFSFKDRILSLFRRHDWLRLIIADSKDHHPTDEEIKAFATRIVKARNSLTHVEKGKEIRGLVDFPIFARVRDMLCCLLLHKAGVKVEDNLRRLHNEWGLTMWWFDELLME
jgi:hypothetical protein